MSRLLSSDVVISSGHNNFHMLFTAAEMEKRGRLNRLICGAYPTPIEHALLKSALLRNSKKLSRFLNRVDGIPSDKISQNRFSEIVSSVGLKFGMTPDDAAIKAFQMYGNKSEDVIRRAAATGARIYHYRAGFGQTSVQVAKDLGMKVICDHSIVHPALLDVFVENKGEYPKNLPPRPNGFWELVLEDIEAADLTVVNSDFVAETFKFMGFDDSKLKIVYQGIEDKFLECLPDNRSYYTGTNRPIRLLFAGGIVPRKGLDELSDVWKQIDSDSIELHLAGSLPDSSRTRYRELLSDPRTTYHGVLSQSELATLMSKADVFLFPSRAEGSARVIFEAMAAGCAVICTHNSGSAVKHEEGGIIVPVNNAEAISCALEELLSSANRIETMGRFNKMLVLQSFRQVSYGNKIESCYEL